MTVASERQKQYPDTLVKMVTITHPTAGTFRFCGNVADPSATITFDSNTYLPRAFQVSGLSAQSGKLPRGSLTIDNVDGFWWQYYANYDEMAGATVEYLEVYRENLDDGASPDTTQINAQYLFEITQSDINALSFEAKLWTSMDREQAMLGREARRHDCPRLYRTPDTTTADTFFYDVATCPYNGSSYFKKDGTSTADWREDDCGQRLSDCKLRFGANANLPYQGFPGIGQQQT